MDEKFNSRSVSAGGLSGAVRYRMPRLRLFGCNGYHTVLWISRGHAKIMANGETHHLSAGTAAIISADTPKLVEISDTSFGSAVAIQADQDFELPAPLLIAKIPNIGEQQKLAGLFETLTNEEETEQFAAEAAKYHMAHYLLVHLMRKSTDPVGKADASQRLMARFTRVLEENYRDGLSLADFAKKLQVTPNHLSRVCQKLNDKTALQLIQDRILAEARFLLATTSHPVNRIGADLGFGTPAYFTRLFSDRNGRAPNAFRDSFQGHRQQGNYFTRAAE